MGDVLLQIKYWSKLRRLKDNIANDRAVRVKYDNSRIPNPYNNIFHFNLDHWAKFQRIYVHIAVVTLMDMLKCIYQLNVWTEIQTAKSKINHFSYM